MKGVTGILVYSPGGGSLLLCKRTLEPYKGLYDLIGGKCETTETGINSAYRELYEETGITAADIELTHVMDFAYQQTQWLVQVFSGTLMRDVPLEEKINPLYWSGLDENFYDLHTFAGEGYIGHILTHLKMQTITQQELEEARN